MLTIDLSLKDPLSGDWILRAGESATASIKKMIDTQSNGSFNADDRSVGSLFRSFMAHSNGQGGLDKGE